MGKAPVLKDGKLTLQESGAITEYVFPFPSCISAIPSVLRFCPSHGLHLLTVPARYLASTTTNTTDQTQRVKVREWIHTAEGAFMVHCLPTVYVRRIDASAAEILAPGLAGNVTKDLDWLEAELKRGNGKYLVGDHVTAADTKVAFSIQFIFWLKLAPQDRK